MSGMINEIFPDEIFELIFKNLDHEGLQTVRQTCKRWKLIVDSCEIIEAYWDDLGKQIFH